MNENEKPSVCSECHKSFDWPPVEVHIPKEEKKGVNIEFFCSPLCMVKQMAKRFGEHERAMKDIEIISKEALRWLKEEAVKDADGYVEMAELTQWLSSVYHTSIDNFIDRWLDKKSIVVDESQTKIKPLPES